MFTTQAKRPSGCEAILGGEQRETREMADGRSRGRGADELKSSVV